MVLLSLKDLQRLGLEYAEELRRVSTDCSVCWQFGAGLLSECFVALFLVSYPPCPAVKDWYPEIRWQFTHPASHFCSRVEVCVRYLSVIADKAMP